MTSFDQIDPINDFLTKIMSINLTDIIFILFDHVPQILTFDVILVPKSPNFDHFHQKYLKGS